jgi:glycosyltransferase involved in cell wall biosynthesis
MATPRHAFVVPAYGESPFLDACLSSLRAQSLPAGEIVIATSTPSPFIAGAAARHGARLAVNAQHVDIASDWNFALRASAAGLVTLAHQDDVYSPAYLETFAAALDRHPEALIAFCDAAEHTPDGPRPANLNMRVKRRLHQRAFGPRECIDDTKSKLRLLAWGNPVNCPSVMFDRRRLPDFRFDGGFASNLDWEAWTRLAQTPGGFVWVRAPLVSHRVHPGSETTALIADRRRQDEDRRMFARFWPRAAVGPIAWVYRLGYRGNRI